MNDPLLLPLAAAAMRCYDADVKFNWEGEDKTSHVLHTTVNGIHTFVFAGTMDLEEWGVDVLVIPVPVPDEPQLGDVHLGFMLGVRRAVLDFILPTLSELKWPPFYLTGHSKGAAQAGLAHAYLKSMQHLPLATRMYEPPFFGGQKLADLMVGDDVEWTETYNIHRTDIITRVPIGPYWKRHKPSIRLQVSDEADFVTMHKMPAVKAALQTLLGEPDEQTHQQTVAEVVS